MQQFVCIYLSEHHQTNHFMLSESLTALDIAWPLFQAVRSLVLSSYVIFLQRLRRGKAHQGFPSIKKLVLYHSTLTHFQNCFFSPNISIVWRLFSTLLKYIITRFRICYGCCNSYCFLQIHCLLIAISFFCVFSLFSSALAFPLVVIESW